MDERAAGPGLSCSPLQGHAPPPFPTCPHFDKGGPLLPSPKACSSRRVGAGPYMAGGGTCSRAGEMRGLWFMCGCGLPACWQEKGGGGGSYLEGALQHVAVRQAGPYHHRAVGGSSLRLLRRTHLQGVGFIQCVRVQSHLHEGPGLVPSTGWRGPGRVCKEQIWAGAERAPQG